MQSDGGLTTDEDSMCCPDPADVGVRPVRRRARGLIAAPPTPGTSAADTLRKRVDLLRQRARADPAALAQRRALKTTLSRKLAARAAGEDSAPVGLLRERSTPTTNTIEKRVDLLRDLTFDV